MSTDANDNRDAVQAHLNPTPDEQGEASAEPRAAGEAEGPRGRSERPADGATKAKWVDYVVELGADRGVVEGTSQHYDDAAGGYVEAPGLTRDELVKLADSLGG